MQPIRPLLALLLIGLPPMISPAYAQAQIEPEAQATLARMCKYLSNTKEFSFTAHDMEDRVLPSGQKIQLSSMRQILVRRPNNVWANLIGDTDNQECWYDGKTLTIHNRNNNTHGSIDVPDNTDDMMDYVAEKYGIVLPLADIIVSTPYQSAMANVQTGHYLGLHSVAGTKCHHLAFQQENLDWQIWIQDGDQPLPRKLVLTFKNFPMQPQYIALIDYWSVSPTLQDDVFTFHPPTGSEEIDLDATLFDKHNSPAPTDTAPAND